MSLADDLERLLEVQARDVALDRLRHRRDTLPERGALSAAEREVAGVVAGLLDLRVRRDALLAEERKFESEASGLQAKAAEVEARMYSGEISSPRELQAMQADVEQLRKHQRSIEGRALDLMEEREPIDEDVAEAEQHELALRDRIAELRASLHAAEGAIDAEAAVEHVARSELTAPIAASLLDEYERCRTRARGVGIARLVGMTCQGCHLTIPSTEVEQIRKSAAAVVAHCDNCGCILVP